MQVDTDLKRKIEEKFFLNRLKRRFKLTLTKHKLIQGNLGPIR